MIVIGIFGCTDSEGELPDHTTVNMSQSIVESSSQDIPEFIGKDSIILNDWND